MDDVPFVDAHVHFWDLAQLRYGWLTAPFSNDGPNGSVEAIAHNYLPSDYRSDLLGWNLVGAVHIDAGADPQQSLDETNWLEHLAAKDGLPTAIVAYAALEAPDVERALGEQASRPLVRGIRQIVNWHPDGRRTYTMRDLTLDEGWRAGFARLAAHGLSFDLQCYPAQVPALAPLLERCEAVSVIVNHLGMPVLDDPSGVADWRDGMRTLAAIPHVAIKLSGLGFIKRDWIDDDIRPFLQEAVKLFGTDRCLVASDVPTDTLFAPLDQYKETYATFAAGFSLDERRNMFGRNANRIYRLGLNL